MALKKNEQLLLDSILQTAKIVKGMVGNDINLINEKLADMLTGFYNESKKKLILSIGEDGEISTRIADYKSDFVRTRYNTEATMLSLRAKINAVPIDIKVVKDDVTLSNKEVADALLELSQIVAGMPLEMSMHGHDDWPRQVGGAPFTLPATEDNSSLVSDELDDSEEGLELELADHSEDEGEVEVDTPAEKPIRRAAVSFMQADAE
tara:strand:- start:1122 stop:1742 length:621 start_codon:yes stop_codon:yes gene_type:complete